MITPDDNAKKNYERVKRWREKNRALVNLKQRNYRREKKNLPVPVLAEVDKLPVDATEARESTQVVKLETLPDSRGGQNDLSGGVESRHAAGSHVTELSQREKDLSQSVSGSSAPPAQTFKDETLERLKGLIKVEEEKPRVEAPVVVKRVYSSETGMVITKEQWEAREAEKNKARSKGFEIDEYSQA